MDGKDGKDGYTPIKGVDYFDGKDGKDGANGFSPSVTVTTNEDTGDVIVNVQDALGHKSATIPKGVDGKDGITPHIGDNGNWFIGETDTGKSSRGIDGRDGQDGQDGQDGYTPQKGVDYFDGEPGSSGVYVGTEPPTDPDVQVWIDPDDDEVMAFLPQTTEAKVGQYLKISNVDADGRVIAVEAVDAPAGGGSGEPGKDGVDGGYYTPVVTQISENTVNLSFTASKEGMDDIAGQQIVLPAGKDGKDGKDGADGEPGKDGYTPVKGKDYFDGLPGNDGTSVSVKNITESTEDGGSNVVTFSDGKTITIRNGSKGSAGATGATGGKGADGRTPVRGTDYWTEADKADIVRQVLASMATPVAGIVDENNNIIITGELPDGAYKLRYEYADGTVAEIGTLNIISGPAYTNLADSTSADWLTNKRINSSKNIVDVTEAQRGDKTVVVTNFISISGVSKLHIKGLDIVSDLVNGSSTQNYGRVYDYAGATILGSSYSPKSGINSKTHYTYADYDSSVLVFDIATMLKDWGGTHTSATHVRLGGVLTGAAEDVIITADENIE